MRLSGATSAKRSIDFTKWKDVDKQTFEINYPSKYSLTYLKYDSSTGHIEGQYSSSSSLCLILASFAFTNSFAIQIDLKRFSRVNTNNDNMSFVFMDELPTAPFYAGVGDTMNIVGLTGSSNLGTIEPIMTRMGKEKLWMVYDKGSFFICGESGAVLMECPLLFTPKYFVFSELGLSGSGAEYPFTVTEVKER